ncbi:MAG: AAA family ATPase [bacterium]|jgi:general secretion pathway protein A
MYEQYWGLKESPFNLTPDPRFLYLSRKHEDALMMLHYAITRNKGAACLIGDIGFGKTTISRKLLELLDPVQYKVVLIVNPLLSPIQMLKEILTQLGVETSSRNRQALLHELQTKLLSYYEGGQRVVVIVDEAHLIKSVASLEELRLLLNCQMNDQFLLSLLLIGQIEMRKMIEKVPALKQRLAVRYELQALDQQETAEMIDYRLRAACFSSEQSPFSPDAVFEIHKYTNGCPRMVCQLADNALMVAMAQKYQKIDGFAMHSIIQSFDGKEW